MSVQDTASEPKRRRVEVVADRLRETIFAGEPGASLGPLPDLARGLGVGIVTVQQAARILEHEGLLEVRRGPGGGYFGRRPDLQSLERSLAAYMRSEPASWEEALDMTSLLFNELCAAAAGCPDAALHAELAGIAGRIAACTSREEIGELEAAMQEQLFRMVRRPLFELLTRVALNVSANRGAGQIGFELDRWKDGRRRIIAAILARDPALAHFEADRNNRRIVLDFIRGG